MENLHKAKIPPDDFQALLPIIH